MSDGAEKRIDIAPSTDVGSERLAAALAAVDVGAIGRALRHDYVIVPLMRGADGETQTRVIEANDPDGEHRWVLALFSSTQAFAQFMGDSPEREFAIRRGSSLTGFIEQYRHLLRRVVFDPAGPHPVQASVEDVLASLQPAAGDDDVSWIADESGAPARGIRPGERVVGLDLALPDDWATIDLTDPKRTKKGVEALLKAQLRGIPQAPVLTAQLTAWLTSTARDAAAAGGQEMAFLTRRTEVPTPSPLAADASSGASGRVGPAAAAVSLTRYWQDLGAPGDHLDQLAARLHAAGGDAQLARAETAAGPFVRHIHRRLGPPELAARPIVVLDYWLEFPDRRGLCLVSFSTPHQDAVEAIARLADGIVLAASWELAPGDAGSTH
ncbi:hypothetical protein ABZ477_06110 [Microbacterium sp. NPDC019599]|uniref:hypothetical protein n=1 Tax=Microbacterium sp. NPDC019599 TaxID=3154690 RepID=UPI0033C51516